MKRYFYLLITVSFLLVGTNAQTIDCHATIRAWEADSSLREYMRTHRCECPYRNQKPVCEERSSEPETTPIPKPQPTPNPAEEQAKREAAWNTRKSELLKLLKKEDEIEFPAQPKPTPQPTPQPTPNPAVYAELRAKTAQSIKQLNCSAYWGLIAANTAINANIEIGKNLDDDLEYARSQAERSVSVRKGQADVACPTVPIEVPDIPPPIAQNPQIRLFDSMSNDLQVLIPEIISTRTQQKDVKDWQDEVKNDITRNRKVKTALDRKPNTSKNKAEKQKKEDEFDALIREAMAAESEAKSLQGKIDGYQEKISRYQNIYDTVTNEPSRAKEFLPK